MPRISQTAKACPAWRIQILALTGFFAFACLTRAPSFLRSVLDWDESLYLLMANAWVSAGHLPYTTIWDNKPPGIYAIFAAALAIGGHHIAAIRAGAIIAVTLTAFAVFRITYALLPPNPARLSCAIMAGLGYSIGALSNDGLAANTEIFMVCCTALALTTALSPGPPSRIGLLTGILCAAAILTKYVAIFEAPAIALALFWWQPKGRRLGCFIATIIGGVLPLAMIIMLYAWHGALGLWWQDSIAANLRRAAAQTSFACLIEAGNTQISRWLPFYLAPLILLWQNLRTSENRRADIFLLLWLIGAAIGVASAKSFYDHYFQQILPVLCVITGLIFARLSRRFMITGFIIFIAIPAYAAGNAIWQITWPVLNPTHQDIPTQIATALTAALQPGDEIYVFDDQPVIYFLTGKTPPTRFVLPSTLTTSFLSHVAAVDAPVEIARILATRPAFIIISKFPAANGPNKNQDVYLALGNALSAQYHPWRGYPTSEIYQRNP